MRRDGGRRAFPLHCPMELKRPEVNERPGSLFKSMQHASWDVLSSLSRLVHLEGGFLILSDLFLHLGEDEAWVDHLLIHRYGFTLIESRTLCVPCTRTFEGRWLQRREEGLCEVSSPVERVKQNAHVVLGLLRDQQEHLLEGDRGHNVIGKLSVDIYVSIALQGDLLTEDVSFSSLIVNVQELGGLVNAKHTERYFAERGRLQKESFQLSATLDADERLELGEALLRQHQPGIGKYDEAGVGRYFGVT